MQSDHPAISRPSAPTGPTAPGIGLYTAAAVSVYIAAALSGPGP